MSHLGQLCALYIYILLYIHIELIEEVDMSHSGQLCADRFFFEINFRAA